MDFRTSSMQTEDEDADIEAALDTDAEMAVGTTLRRRKVSKDKRSISKRLGGGGASSKGLGLGGKALRRATSFDAEQRGGAAGPSTGAGGASGSVGGGGGGGGGSSSGSRSHKRRVRRHSTPGFSLNDGDSDGDKRKRLQHRLEAMRRLPRSSR